MAVDAARIRIVINTNAKKATAEMAGLDKQTKKTGGSFKDLAKGLLGPIGVAAAVTATTTALVKFGKATIQAASDAEETANKMKTIMRWLYDEQLLSADLIEAKAKTTADYKRQRALFAVKAKGDGMSVTLIKHHVEGLASNLEYDMIVATESLKAHWIKMENLKAQLNAYQSINRYLAVT